MRKSWIGGGGYTPLHLAAEKNSKEIGELLIAKGADINAKDNIEGNMVLFFLMKTILNKEKQLNKKNETPLHYAADNNAKEIGEILISRGADLNAKDIIYRNITILFLIKRI